MISSAANGKIKQVVTLRDKSRARNREGIFVAEGIKMFMEAPLDRLREVYCSEGFWEQVQNQGAAYADVGEKLRCCNEKGILVEQVSKEVLRHASDTQTPQGILFVMEQMSYSLKEMVEKAVVREKEGGRAPLFLILEDIQDPGNLGTMIRTGEGSGVDGIIMSKGTVDIYNPKTIRATMGSLYRVPFVYGQELHGAIRLLQENQITVYAAHLKGEQYFDEIAYEGGSAFLIGNEGKGLTAEVSKQADCYLKIPMEGKLESLNAAVAAALLMYQAGGYGRKIRKEGKNK
ncbi:MAG: RNA methyltransferase [Lachnospiraceae bacterium]|nr:RNA methyltransferase [Lachnospiraceae bacterium]MDE6185152.1 RNA methyltransferase [Lachnospiraceae bacterium]